MCKFFFYPHSIKIQYSSYVHSIYIVLGIVHNLDMTLNIQQDVCIFYANANPFYIRALNILGFLVSIGGWSCNQAPCIQRSNCLYMVTKSSVLSSNHSLGDLGQVT
jgi:hypothetical protein